jgi:hypothetical protein
VRPQYSATAEPGACAIRGSSRHAKRHEQAVVTAIRTLSIAWAATAIDRLEQMIQRELSSVPTAMDLCCRSSGARYTRSNLFLSPKTSTASVFCCVKSLALTSCAYRIPSVPMKIASTIHSVPKGPKRPVLRSR